MLKYELQNAADRLVKDIFGVKPGETVAITADTCSNMDVVDAVAASATAAGANPMVIIMKTPRGVGKAADPDLPLESLTAALLKADVWVEFNHQWLIYSTPYTVSEKENKKLRYMSLPDLDPAVFTRIIGKCDCAALQEFMEKTWEMHRAAKTMKITTPAGTDVSFEIEPTHYMTCDHGAAQGPGMHMAPGQLNVVPRFGTINGTIVFDGSVTPPFGRVLNEPIRLTVENSKIIKVDGGVEAAQYEKWLKSFNDEGMMKMAHVAYGFNPGAELTGNVVEDERVWGATEWGIGFVSEFDAPPNGQDAASHSDGICLNSSVWLDGEAIMQEGKIVHEKLAPLSPVK